MHPIPMPTTNYRHPDRVLAQTVASHSDWQHNDAGNVFDAEGTILANSLEDLAIVMRALGWFTPGGTTMSGVMWSEMPAGEDEGARRAAEVHAMAKKLGV